MVENLAKLSAALSEAAKGKKQNPFLERRSEPRLWCSDLVQVWLKKDGRWRRIGAAVLEDISRSGACVQTEEAIPQGSMIRVKHDDWKIEGEVRYCTFKETGYFVGLHLEESQKWSEEIFRPKHLIDPGKVVARKKSKP